MPLPTQCGAILSPPSQKLPALRSLLAQSRRPLCNPAQIAFRLLLPLGGNRISSRGCESGQRGWAGRGCPENTSRIPSKSPCTIGLWLCLRLLAATAAPSPAGAHGTISRRKERTNGRQREREQFSPLEAILGFDLSLQ